MVTAKPRAWICRKWFFSLAAFAIADPKMSALQIYGMCNYAWTWYKPDGSQSVEEIARIFARNILGGLARKPAEDAEDAALDELIIKAIATVQRAPGPAAAAARRVPGALSALTRASGHVAAILRGANLLRKRAPAQERSPGQVFSCSLALLRCAVLAAQLASRVRAS